MAEVTNERIYKVLTAMQAPLGNLYEAYGAIDARLFRIERRLDIIDIPVT